MIEFESFARYLTFSARDTLWSCYCTTTGCDRSAPDGSYPPHPEFHPQDYNFPKKGRILQEYALVYILRGKGKLIVGDEEYTLKSGSVFFLFPGISHFYAPDPETGWDEYWVGFNGPEIKRLHEQQFFSPERPLYQIGVHQNLIRFFNDIIDLAKREPPAYQLNMGSTILRLISSILALEQKHNQPGESELLVEKSKALLTENIHSNITIEEIAAEMGLNSSRFGKIFKNYTGLTPYQYFLHMRINRAKELLEPGEYTIKEVAFKLHFNDQYHFSKLFKQKAGLSPTQWLKSRYQNK